MDYTAPTLDEIETIAHQTVQALPEKFRVLAADVVICVAEFADDDLLRDLEVDAFELSGLYEGIPVTEKSSMDQPTGPDTVWLFRRALLDEWAARGNVTMAELVAHVTVHEFAHHFGWSDDDIARIDEWWT